MGQEHMLAKFSGYRAATYTMCHTVGLALGVLSQHPHGFHGTGLRKEARGDRGSGYH